ncbi:hypothetical protein F4813DRAFT_202816 [Daldinia decipiens]|uniref:uncharacterized protein n=1 Tax=Daldinia decipiens TaxID=326647 RepID=UPI0020C1EDDA|nr:uncharacterized protein F4813DRAFT_202816 [Daldinia decipiens]KAI1654515.1 hypothetical protein F4813DRAFT_202816 [Daldinia decipiens]
MQKNNKSKANVDSTGSNRQCISVSREALMSTFLILDSRSAMPPPSQTMQMQLPLRLKPRLGPKPSSHKPPIKPRPKQLTMCSTVHFTYRCGCTHTTTFECPDTASSFSSLATSSHSHSRRNRPRRRRRCCGPKSTPTITPLDEDCYDCAQKREKTGGRTASLGDSDVSSFSLSTDADADTDTELDTDTSMAASTSTSRTTSISSAPSTRASSPLDMSVLKERDPNLPSKCPLISILDLDLDLRMQLIDLDLPELLGGF